MIEYYPDLTRPLVGIHRRTSPLWDLPTLAYAPLLYSVVALSLGLPSMAAIAREPDENIAGRILVLHNRERLAVGTPPLAWDPALAASAASYGPTLASLGRLVHSPRASRPGQRENLAVGSTALDSLEDLVGLWSAEKQLFQPGIYPFVTRTDDWKDVSHYTQMIWRSTTKVGCALHPAGDRHYLVCRYSPPGNADGRPVP